MCCSRLIQRAPTYQPTSHDTDNYGVITKGELILTVEGNVQKVGVGEWYHVPALVEHSAMFEVETDEIEFWFKPGAA